MTLEDPFAPKTATNTPDEAQTEPGSVFDSAPAEAPKKTTPRKASVKTTNTPEENQTGVTVTFKAPGGNTAPWIVIHASSVSDALEQVKGENAPILVELMERTAVANQEFAKQFPNTPAAAPAQAGKPAAASGAPGGETRSCVHGERIFYAGVTNGKTWEAFFCPLEKGDPNKCKVEYKDKK